MSNRRIDHMDMLDHHSIAASLEDFERAEQRTRSPAFGIPSQYSAFRSDSELSEELDQSYSPPAWRKAGSGWYNHQQFANTPSQSRETSPQYESAGEGEPTAVFPGPAQIPLPGSPLKGRSPSPSPEPPYPRGDEFFASTFGGQVGKEREHVRTAAENPNNCKRSQCVATWVLADGIDIRFATRIEMQHRTEPFEAVISFVRKQFDHVTRSPLSTISATIILFIAIATFRILFQPPSPGPVPDLIKVAGVAKNFEPLIYYSEHGLKQIGDLQETSVAVWDLGESVRNTNMTSAPIIVQELDDLSEAMKTLAMELTKFFARIDGDVDSILLVMEWAKRELVQLNSLPVTSFSSLSHNVQSILSYTGVLETASGTPTSLGRVVADVFGQTTVQRTKRGLHRTFIEFLAVLEEAIEGELTYSTTLFRLFEDIDQRFLNLQRTVVRESDTQEREEAAILSSLWNQVIGGNANALRKFEKNKQLLHDVRDKTKQNKWVLIAHNGRLSQLKANLEILRQMLVSPLVRGATGGKGGSMLSLEEQIRGLDSTYEHLKVSRERQRTKMLESMYAATPRRINIGRSGDGYAVEGN
ncbi:hypothetical protein LTR04_003692 [Oleoguttula sp. CCFEE 6159]|nr:hypothetical protein LTR04_003692 [Oleoguttula sp. CCFEE 6159]